MQSASIHTIEHLSVQYNVPGMAFTNYGTIQPWPVKHVLSADEVLDYGKRLAYNQRHRIAEIKDGHRDAVQALEKEREERASDAAYFMDHLDSTSATAEHALGYTEARERLRGIDEQIGSIKIQMRASVQAITMESEILALAIRLGFEMRPVSCTWWVDWDAGIKHLVRIDTGEKVLDQKLRDEERQLELLWDDIDEQQLAALRGEE